MMFHRFGLGLRSPFGTGHHLRMLLRNVGQALAQGSRNDEFRPWMRCDTQPMLNADRGSIAAGGSPLRGP